MKRAVFAMSGLILSLSCTAMMHSHTVNYSSAMKLKMGMYKKSSESALLPYLHRVGLNYHPKQIAILVFKKSRVLELWARNQGPWEHVKNFPVLAASGHAGPKLKNQDHQVPEGIYRITGFNPVSRFDLSMHVGYPNPFDLMQAKKSHRRNLGGDIFIHGSNRSIGCIAIGNKNIEALFPFVVTAGKKNTEVIIAPNDLRTQAPVYSKHHPRWLPTLYAEIKQQLTPFKV